MSEVTVIETQPNEPSLPEVVTASVTSDADVAIVAIQEEAQTERTQIIHDAEVAIAETHAEARIEEAKGHSEWETRFSQIEQRLEHLTNLLTPPVILEQSEPLSSEELETIAEEVVEAIAEEPSVSIQPSTSEKIEETETEASPESVVAEVEAPLVEVNRGPIHLLV